MFSSHRLLLIFFLVLITLLSALISSRLLWSNNPNFFFQESYGLAYNHPLRLGDLCDPNPLAGLEGPMANVTDHRSSSLIYALPNKLFYNHINLYTLHRIINGILYALLLLLLYAIGSALKLHPASTLLFLVYYGLSTQALSLLFEFKLTLTSAVWLAWAILLFVLLDKSRISSKSSAFIYVGLVPITAALSYETYCVSRPLAIAYWGAIFIWLFLIAPNHKLRGYYSAIYAVSSALSYLLLKFLHPNIRFDLSLFEGRTESIVQYQGHLKSEWLTTILNRVQELSYLFSWPNHSIFTSESYREAGWLEVWLALGFLSAVAFALLFFQRSGPATRKLFYQYRWYLLMCLMLMAISLIIPLGSTTFIRGHRFFGLYLTSTLLAVILVDILIKVRPAWIKWSVVTFAITVSLWTLVHRLPLIYNWSPPTHYTPTYFHDLLVQLQQTPIPDNYSPDPGGVVIKVCDLKEPLDWEHSWNAALYVSGLGCRLQASRLHGHIMNFESCDCAYEEKNADLVNLVCIERRIEGERNIVTLNY